MDETEYLKEELLEEVQEEVEMKDKKEKKNKKENKQIEELQTRLAEMTDRYKKFAANGVREIKSYNDNGPL